MNNQSQTPKSHNRYSSRVLSRFREFKRRDQEAIAVTKRKNQNVLMNCSRTKMINTLKTKNIWLIDNSYSIAPLFVPNVVLVNDGVFPPN